MNVIGRAEWEAKYGQGNPTSGAKTTVIVHHDGHTRSRADMTVEQEEALMRFYEDYHVNGEEGHPGLTATNPRIGYSFVVMQSGRVYEGCGWDHIGAHTLNMNSSGYGVFFPLNGATTAPTPEALASFTELRAEGVRLGHLSADHAVKGHQDFNKPSCPGKLVYDAAVRGTIASDPSTTTLVQARPTLRRGKGGTGGTAEERTVVKYLQHRLVAVGVMAPGLPSGASAATGYYGPATEAAVKKFQQANGLTPDGLVGSRTWAKLNGKAA